MLIIGLTGSIGMGKTTAAKMFADLGAVVWSADAAVHRLYEKGGAGAAAIADRFPDVIVDGAVDRGRLAARVLNDPDAMAELEAMIHPLVAADRRAVIEGARRAGAPAVVLDIPLLFETGAADQFDAVVVVSAPADVQRARVLSRPVMTEAKFEAILARQLPDDEKRRRADIVIDTGGPVSETEVEIASAWRRLLGRGSEL